jgi:hypothetical protein
MESPAVLVFAWGFAAGQRKDLVAVVFCALFCGHYLYRSLLYPLLRRSKTAMPLAIVASGLAFNCVNGSLQAGYLFSLAPAYPVAWLLDVRFLAGLPVFVAGFAIHFRADAQLIALRRTRQGKYVMPRGALFGWISCPNYFGELIEWVGWALLTWSWAGAAFALWTAANLVPRALAYHRWYQQTFADYPPARRAIIPLVL